MQDARYALRALGRTPGFTAIASCRCRSASAPIRPSSRSSTRCCETAAVPTRRSPCRRPEQPLASDETVAVHRRNFLAWRARVRAFEAIAIAQRPPVNVLGPDGAEQVSSATPLRICFACSASRRPPGRDFTAVDATPGSEPVAILGYRCWQRRFGGSRAVIGQRLLLSDGSRTIVGIASPELKLGLTEPDVYTPLAIDPSDPGAVGSRSFECYARLRPGVALTEARAELDAVARPAGTRAPARSRLRRVRQRPAGLSRARGASGASPTDGGGRRRAAAGLRELAGS